MSPTIHVVCPSCDARIKAPSSMAGRKARCPKCEATFTIEPESRSVDLRPDNAPAEKSTESHTLTKSISVDDRESHPAASSRLVEEAIRACADFNHHLEKDNRAAGEVYLGLALQSAQRFIDSHPEAAVGWVTKGLMLSYACHSTTAAACFTEAVRRDGVGLGRAELAPLIDRCAEYYISVTFVPDELLGLKSPDGMKELVAALQKVLILADREVPLPGSANQETSERIRAIKSEPISQDNKGSVKDSLEQVRCAAYSQYHSMGQDNAGKRTKCPKCQELLPVPTSPQTPVAPRSNWGGSVRSRLWAVWRKCVWFVSKPSGAATAILIFIPLCLGTAGFIVESLRTPHEWEIKTYLSEHLPPHKEFTFYRYEPNKEGLGLMFEVTIQAYGNPLGAEFMVTRTRWSNDGEDTVKIEAERWDLSTLQHVQLVKYTFKGGKLTHREVLGATALEGQWLEETAYKLDEVVRNAY